MTNRLVPPTAEGLSVTKIGSTPVLSPVMLTIETHRNALAADDRNSGNMDAADVLNLAERAAWEAFIATPCTTPADVQAKLEYIVGSQRLTDWLCDGNDEPLEVLRSLIIRREGSLPA